MSLADDTQALLVGLASAGVELIVVGMSAAVAQGVPAVTFDLDIVHRRSDDNVDRLLVWLLVHGAFHRFDLANRRLPPTREVLLGSGHVNLQTNHGKLDGGSASGGIEWRIGAGTERRNQRGERRRSRLTLSATRARGASGRSPGRRP